MSSNYTRRINYPAVTPENTITVGIGAAHAESAVISADAVRLIATAACFVTFGADPVADNTAMYLPANVPEIFQFTPGDKVSVIRSAGDGTLYITSGE